MDPQEYVSLHGWFTQGLSLGQIGLDDYKAAVKRLADAFAAAPPVDVESNGQEVAASL